jgi:hypothetical protein
MIPENSVLDSSSSNTPLHGYRASIVVTNENHQTAVMLAIISQDSLVFYLPCREVGTLLAVTIYNE